MDEHCFKWIGLEAGPLSQWLFSALAEAGLPVICVETRHMRAVLQAQINIADGNRTAATSILIERLAPQWNVSWRSGLTIALLSELEFVCLPMDLSTLQS